jgi:hypothetical protein
MASPTARRERGLLIIEIPEDNIILGVEGTPRVPVRVTDREAFLNALADCILERELSGYDAPVFFKAIEDITTDMAESGDEFVEPV